MKSGWEKKRRGPCYECGGDVPEGRVIFCCEQHMDRWHSREQARKNPAARSAYWKERYRRRKAEGYYERGEAARVT